MGEGEKKTYDVDYLITALRRAKTKAKTFHFSMNFAQIFPR